jgi:hypothetical protein
MTSNNFCPSAFDRDLVPKRARRSGSALDHGRVVLEEVAFILPSFFGRDTGLELAESRLTDTKPAMLEFFGAIPEHIQPFPSSPGSIRSGLVKTAVMCFISTIHLVLIETHG